MKNFCIRNPGKGIVLLISDLMDKEGYETALRYFVSHEMDCYVIHLLSQEELEPDVKGDLKLVDCEDADEAEITVSAPLLARYQQTLTAFTRGAQEFCTRRGMHYMLANNQAAGGRPGRPPPAPPRTGSMTEELNREDAKTQGDKEMTPTMNADTTKIESSMNSDPDYFADVRLHLTRELISPYSLASLGVLRG